MRYSIGVFSENWGAASHSPWHSCKWQDGHGGRQATVYGYNGHNVIRVSVDTLL